MKIIFLGTSGSVPTPKRGAPAIAVVRENELFLFDCGEGTQQKIITAGLGFGRRTRILVTHLHGDHLYGLPGLMQTMSLLGRERPLQIYGPKGIGVFLGFFSAMFGNVGFPVEIQEIAEKGVVCSGKGYQILAAPLDHSTHGWSYALVEDPRPGRFHPEKALELGIPKGRLWKEIQEGRNVTLQDGRTIRPGDIVESPRPGRKIVYSGDTRPNTDLVELARDADVLIHESTFGDELADKALLDGHSTPSQAGEAAAKARVGLLLLTHISPRYVDTTSLLEEARKVFGESRIAEDLMKIEIPLKN